MASCRRFFRDLTIFNGFRLGEFSYVECFLYGMSSMECCGGVSFFRVVRQRLAFWIHGSAVNHTFCRSANAGGQARYVFGYSYRFLLDGFEGRCFYYLHYVQVD